MIQVKCVLLTAGALSGGDSLCSIDRKTNNSSGGKGKGCAPGHFIFSHGGTDHNVLAGRIGSCLHVIMVK